ncbi:MAG: XisI protein [Fimbriiglobus sp.]
MDKLTRYRDVVKACLLDWLAYVGRARMNGTEPQCAFDDERGQYLLLFTGWHKGERDHQVFLHVRIRDGKVWVEEDGTEEGVTPELVRAGVPASDIVLAFHPPELRHLTDFAVA